MHKLKYPAIVFFILFVTYVIWSKKVEDRQDINKTIEVLLRQYNEGGYPNYRYFKNYSSLLETLNYKLNTFSLDNSIEQIFPSATSVKLIGNFSLLDKLLTDTDQKNISYSVKISQL